MKMRILIVLLGLSLLLIPERPWPNRARGRELLIPGPIRLTKADEARVKSLKDQLDGFLHLSSNAGVAPASGIIVGLRGQVLYSNFERLSPTTSLWIASSTKPLTSAAVFRMAKLGLVNVDLPINMYVPDLKIENPDLRGGAVTIRHLLQQVSGIPYNGRSPMVNVHTAKSPLWVPKQIYATDLHYEYSNANYEILALLIETVMQKPYDDAMKELVFDPLGMENSKAPGPMKGASNANASVRDLARFADAMVQAINGQRDDFLGEMQVQNFLELPSYFPKPKDKETLFYYGAGWWGYREGTRLLCFYHTGIWNGTYSEIAIFPEHQAYFVHISNPPALRGKAIENYRRTTGALAKALISAATLSPVKLESVGPTRPSAERLARYAGKYIDQRGNTLEFQVRGDTLLKKIGGSYITLSPHTINEFTGTDQWNNDQFVHLDGDLVGYSDVNGFYRKR